MFQFISRIVVIAASTSVVVPYAAALLCHILYGRQPLRSKALIKSLHPRKVYALNTVFLKKLALMARYSPLYIQWRSFYITADSSKLIKVGIHITASTSSFDI